MESTVIGLYADNAQAQDAQYRLLRRGYCRDDIELIAVEPSPMAQTSQSTLLQNGRDSGFFFPLVSGWFEDGDHEQDYHPEYHADIFAEARRLGGCLLIVQAKNRSQQHEIVNILDSFSPLMISDEKAHLKMPAGLQASHSASTSAQASMPQAQRPNAAF